MALPKLSKEFDYQSFDCGIDSFNNYQKQILGTKNFLTFMPNLDLKS